MFWGTQLEDCQLQDGPQCGMVALSMATSVLPPHVSADAIQDAAVKRGFSRRGEMFSCDNLCTLANDLLSGRADGKVKDGDLIRNIRWLWDEFSEGSLFL